MRTERPAGTGRGDHAPAIGNESFDSINDDVFWELVENVDDHTQPRRYTESEWRGSEF